MKLVYKDKKRMNESYIYEPYRAELDDLLRALDELGYNGCFEEHNGKIIADDVTLKQIQNALIDEYGWEYDIINKDEYDESVKKMNESRLREDVDEREIGRAIKNTRLLLMDYLNERGNSASVFARSGIEKAIDALGGLMLLFPTKINESLESTSSILSKMKNIMGWWDPSDEDREYVSNVYDPSKYVDRSKDTYCGIPAYGFMNTMIEEKWIPTRYITSDEWEDGDGAYHETYEPVFLSLEAAVSSAWYKRQKPYRCLGHTGDEHWPFVAGEKDIWESKRPEIITKYID